MANNTLRTIACLMAMLVAGVASTHTVLPAVASTTVQPAASHGTQAPAAAVGSAARKTGRGLAAFFGCAGCAIAGTLIIAGGPGSIFVAVNTPGSSIALLACAATCYEVLAK